MNADQLYIPGILIFLAGVAGLVVLFILRQRMDEDMQVMGGSTSVFALFIGIAMCVPTVF